MLGYVSLVFTRTVTTQAWVYYVSGEGGQGGFQRLTELADDILANVVIWQLNEEPLTVSS